jgi:hypothetical protein
MQVPGGKGIAGGDVSKAHERVHQRELPRLIEFQSRNALTIREACRFGELRELPAIDEGLPLVSRKSSATSGKRCYSASASICGRQTRHVFVTP